jgi:chaperone BCS1
MMSNPVAFSNPVFQGGLGLMLLGGVLALMRNLPNRLWHMVTRKFWLECFIDGSDEAFYWVNQWLALRPEVQTSNMLRVESRWFDDDFGDRNERRSTLIPGVGDHLVSVDGAKFWLSVTKEEIPPKQTGGPGAGFESMFRPYSLKIRCRSAHRPALLKLLSEADKLSLATDPTRTRIYLPSYETWRLRSVQHIRKAESVVLAEGVFERLYETLIAFTNAKARYEELGVPYRYGCMLHGMPGNGKSSLVLSLAGALGRDLYILSLGNKEMDDHNLLTLMSSVPQNSIVLVEDIDTIFHGRDRKAENKLTFSGVLNAIDGALASEGRMLFVTANEPEVLDAALIRPGRCDDHVELKNATPEQSERLFLRFFPGAIEGAKAFSPWAGNGLYSMAALQGHLLAHQHKQAAASLEPNPRTLLKVV